MSSEKLETNNFVLRIIHFLEISLKFMQNEIPNIKD